MPHHIAFHRGFSIPSSSNCTTSGAGSICCLLWVGVQSMAVHAVIWKRCICKPLVLLRLGKAVKTLNWC